MNIKTQAIHILKQPVAIALLALLGILVVLAGIKMMQFRTMMGGGAFIPPPESVTTAVAQKQTWEDTLNAVGSLTAMNGVMISAEYAGQIINIAFTPGTDVKKGDLLVQQDVSAEQAQLRAAIANAELGKISLQRSEDLVAKKLTSQSEYDAAAARYKEAVANVDNIRTLIEKKSIRAPFAGRVGTRNVYVGQHLREGDPIVSLQALDTLKVDFMLPQQYLASVKAGLAVRIHTDALPGEQVAGVITAVDSRVDASTRNFQVQAKIDNAGHRLLPGVFADVEVILPQEEPVLAIPATSVLYAAYGASVFVVDKKTDEKTGTTTFQARQQFVKLGRSKGDFVAVETGLQENDEVVSTGAFKLHNGQGVVAHNDMAPSFELNPQPSDS